LTDDLITRYQVKDSTTIPGKSYILNTYVNANSSRAYGLEITSKNKLANWYDVTTNLNVYNSSIDGGNLDQNLDNERWSFFGKISNNFKFPKDFTIQLSADYRSRAILPQGGGGGFGGGRGGGGFGFTQTTSQGYINPNYGVDIAIRKEFMKDKRASLTLSVNDIFKTRKYSIHSESEFFVQDSWRRMDWRVFRLNFNYRFGKFDVSLFKRKNIRSGQEGLNEGTNMQ
jgi:outer membrane receptor for ferrienterochelin and colicin